MDKGVKLIIDARERHITRHANELREINHEIKQITTADYVISDGNNILVAIERKTLPDFAASLKDGRSDNKEKLIKLREKTNCRIIYIIEGPAFPDPNDTFGRIPYRYIESSIFHLMIRDGFTIHRCRDTLDTIKVLSRMCTSINNIRDKKVLGGAIPLGDPIPVDNVISELTVVHTKTDIEILREAWSCFPGISIESADEYNHHWTLAEIVSGKIDRASITNFKLKSGRSISKKVVQSLTGVNSTIEARLLSKIPGISTATSKLLVTERSLHQLLSYGEEGISMCSIGKKKLGKEKAKKILTIFNYKCEKI